MRYNMLNRDVAENFVQKHSDVLTHAQKLTVCYYLRDGKSTWEEGSFIKGSKKLALERVDGAKQSRVIIETVGEEKGLEISPNGDVRKVRVAFNQVHDAIGLQI